MEMHSSSRMTGVIWAGRALRPQLFRRTSKSVSSLLEIIFRSGVASFPLPSDHFQIVALADYFNGSSAVCLSAVKYLENSIQNRAISFVSPTVTFESWRDYEVEARGIFVEVILTFSTTLSGRFFVTFAGNSHGIVRSSCGLSMCDYFIVPGGLDDPRI